MLYSMENPILFIWMRTGGTPMDWKPPCCHSGHGGHSPNGEVFGQWVNIELIHIDSRPGRPQRLECLCCFSLSQSIEGPNLDPFCHMRIAWGDDWHMRIWWGHSWFIRIFIQEWHDWFYIWGLGILLEDDGDRRYIIYPRKTCLFEKSFNYPSP